MKEPVKYLIVILCFAALALCGCGSSKQASGGGWSDFSSRDLPGSPGSANSGKLTECNRFGFSNDGDAVAISLATYYVNGAIREDLVQINFNDAPANIHTSNKQYLQIFRFSESSTNNRSTDNSAVKMFFVEKGSGNVLNPDEPVNTLSSNTISKFIQKHPYITGSNFFDRVQLVLNDMDLRWHAIKVVIYDSTNNVPISNAEALVPAFSADPNKYAANHPSLGLQALHPNFTRRASGETEAQYFAYTESFCDDFF